MYGTLTCTKEGIAYVNGINLLGNKSTEIPCRLGEYESMGNTTKIKSIETAIPRRNACIDISASLEDIKERDATTITFPTGGGVLEFGACVTGGKGLLYTHGRTCIRETTRVPCQSAVQYMR